MAFENYAITEIQPVDAGILNTGFSGYKVDSYKTYEDGLIIGRFAKLDTGSIDNLDNSATPVIAGVVIKTETNAMESENTYTTAGDGAVWQPEVCSYGLVTVDVVVGDTPAKFGTVYAVNAAASGVDFGKATTTATDNVEVAGYFNREIKTNVWEVFVKL